MVPPPKDISGADVICYAIIDSSVTQTGACKHRVRGQVMGPAAALAICKYSDAEGFYLFYCDEQWVEWTDTLHDSVSRAKAQAEFEYAGITSKWVDAHPPV